MSGIVNKIKDAVSGDKHHEAPQGSHGPHSSAAANTADPRVDSDRDHRANPTSTVGGTGAHTTGTHTGAHTAGGAGYGSNEVPQGTHGPHGSKVANTVDPRVDSDRDHRANPTSSTIGGTSAHTTGAHTGTHTGTHTGAHTAGGAGYGSTHEAPQGTHGPHGSKVANTVDPRVDSDRDHRANPASNVGGTHNTYGSTGHSTGSSGLTGSAGTHGVGHHAAPGPAPTTAGPHKSDLLNKADPRVDSNLDGSKTVGGDKTYTSSNTTRDPTDASQVPPSVLRQHVGDPAIHHEDHGHNRDRRNSTATHQETHRGI